MQKAIIVDLDGCLANCDHRVNVGVDPETGKRDWKEFYDAMSDDTLDLRVMAIVNAFRVTNHSILILTGRPENYRFMTTEWFKKYGVIYDYLFMRGEDDFRKAPVFKKDVYLKKIIHAFDVRMAIDDDQGIVAMYQEFGIPCISPSPPIHVDAAKVVEEVVTKHLVSAVLGENKVPADTKVGWLRDFSVTLARDVVKGLKG